MDVVAGAGGSEDFVGFDHHPLGLLQPAPAADPNMLPP